MTDATATGCIVVDDDVHAMVDRFIARERNTLVELCRRLVGARSVNPPGDTRAAAEVVSAYLTGCGIDCQVLSRTDLKANVVSTCSGDGEGRHLVLNGHLDTIPPGDESDWSIPPFSLTRRDGRLYGLGMGNMKAAIAALACAYVALHRCRDRWPGRVSLTAVPDETVFGPDGAAWLLEEHAWLRGNALICGEGPGGMDLAVAEKGVLWLAIEAVAPAGQGMLSRRGRSATARLARVIAEIDGLNELFGTPPPQVAVLAEHAGEEGLRVSVNTGRIEGGRLISQIAVAARAEVDFRLPPGLTISDIEGRVRAVVGAVEGVRWHRIKGWEPNWTVPGETVVRAVGTAAERVRGAPPGARGSLTRKRWQPLACTRHTGGLLRTAARACFGRR